MIKLAIEQKQLSHLSSPTQVTNGNWSSQVTLKSHCNPEGEARGLQLKCNNKWFKMKIMTFV